MVLKVIPDRCCCLCNKILNVSDSTIKNDENITIVHKVCLIRAKKIREHKQKIAWLNLEWEYWQSRYE